MQTQKSLRKRSTIDTAGSPATEQPDSSDDEREPLNPSASTPSQQVISQTLSSAANLANLLPTGTLMAFQLLVPIFTNNGTCDSVTQPLTMLLLILLSLSSFLACFTDSFKSSDGKVYHGIATPKGMLLFDYPGDKDSSLPDLSKHKLRAIDFVHGVLTVLVFISVALRDRNVLSCFDPNPKHETQELLDILPVGLGVMCGLLFMVFPTSRHGIGYPVTPGN